MAKPDPQRLQLAAYPIHRHTEPRFGDVDALRHLNNVALGRIYEDARVRFFDGIGIREAFEPGSGFVMAELTIQYLAEGQFPDPLIVGTGVVKVGGASAAVGQGLFQNGRCIGTSEAVVVYVDRKAGRPKLLPEAVRTLLLAHALPGCEGGGAKV